MSRSLDTTRRRGEMHWTTGESTWNEGASHEVKPLMNV